MDKKRSIVRTRRPEPGPGLQYFPRLLKHRGSPGRPSSTRTWLIFPRRKKERTRKIKGKTEIKVKTRKIGARFRHGSFEGGHPVPAQRESPTTNRRKPEMNVDTRKMSTTFRCGGFQGGPQVPPPKSPSRAPQGNTQEARN